MQAYKTEEQTKISVDSFEPLELIATGNIRWEVKKKYVQSNLRNLSLVANDLTQFGLLSLKRTLLFFLSQKLSSKTDAHLGWIHNKSHYWVISIPCTLLPESLAMRD